MQSEQEYSVNVNGSDEQARGCCPTPEPTAEQACCGGPSQPQLGEAGCCGDGMSRRSFLAATGLTTAGLVAGLPTVRRTYAQPVSVDHFVPEDKQLTAEWLAQLTAKGERKVYRGAELQTIGMPCGGVAAGQLYVLGDGSLGYWWNANNSHNTGYGHHYEIDTPLGEYPVTYTPEPFTPPTPVDQGFALRVGNKIWQLNADGFEDIGFIGEYPIAEISYDKAKGDSPPVKVNAQVFSPFIPINTRDSATPATTLRYTVTNTSGQTQEVALGGWLQNPVMLTHKDGWKGAARQRNQSVNGKGWSGVTMDCVEKPQPEGRAPKLVVFEDFEDGYGQWTLEGQAFGDKPSGGTMDQQQPVSGFEGKGLVNTFRGGSDAQVGKATSKTFKIEMPYIWFLVGGGSHANTAIRLVVDGEVVHATSGDNNERLRAAYWNVSDFKGQEAHIEIVDENRGGWGHINIDQIVFADQPPKLDGFEADHQYMGQVTLAALGSEASTRAAYDSKQAFLDALTQSDKLEAQAKQTYDIGEAKVAGVTASATLEPGESKSFDFVLGWYYPNRRADIHRGWGSANGQTDTPVGNRYNNWYDHANDVIDYMAAGYGRLTEQTYLFRDTLYDTSLPYWLIQRLSMPLANLASETCTWREDGYFWAWEGVGCCLGNCGHVWNYAQGMARLFPELERSVRTNQDFKSGNGYDDRTGLIRFRGAGSGWAGDAMGGYILKAYRDHLCSADDSFLREYYPKIKKSIEFMVGEDGKDGKVDGFLEGRQHNTYDIDYFGANTLVGAMYHAALRAGAKMAEVVGDDAFVERCTKLADQGVKSTMDRIWREDWGYFIQDVDLAKHPHNQQGDGCLADQLLGQSLAHQCGLGYIYPEAAVKKTMASIWKYNWAPDVGPQNEVHPPERWYCRPGEAGLFMCTWPKTKHLGPTSVRYRDEVWTGTEYQVASQMLYDGMITEPLAIIRAIHDRYDGVKHNPWNEIECGDHYARALASWGCLLGVSGFTYDGPAGHIGFNPKLESDDFKCFFSAAEGWGAYSQTIKGKALDAKLDLKWGDLKLSTISLGLPEGRKAASVTLNGKQQKITTNDDGSVTIKLDKATTFNRGEAIGLEVAFR